MKKGGLHEKAKPLLDPSNDNCQFVVPWCHNVNHDFNDDHKIPNHFQKYDQFFPNYQNSLQ